MTGSRTNSLKARNSSIYRLFPHSTKATDRSVSRVRHDCRIKRPCCPPLAVLRRRRIFVRDSKRSYDSVRREGPVYPTSSNSRCRYSSFCILLMFSSYSRLLQNRHEVLRCRNTNEAGFISSLDININALHDQPAADQFTWTQ